MIDITTKNKNFDSYLTVLILTPCGIYVSYNRWPIATTAIIAILICAIVAMFVYTNTSIPSIPTLKTNRKKVKDIQ
jgi:anti-sigma-K factor RskA